MPTVPPRGADLEKQVCRAWVPRLHISTQPLLYGKEFPRCPKEEATMETEEKIIMFVLCAVTPNIVPFSSSYGKWRQHVNQRVEQLGKKTMRTCWGGEQTIHHICWTVTIQFRQKRSGDQQCAHNLPGVIFKKCSNWNETSLATCLCSRRPWCQHTCKLNATQLPLRGTRWPLACG